MNAKEGAKRLLRERVEPQPLCKLRWSPSIGDNRNPRGIISALLASWIGMTYLIEERSDALKTNARRKVQDEIPKRLLQAFLERSTTFSERRLEKRNGRGARSPEGECRSLYALKLNDFPAPRVKRSEGDTGRRADEALEACLGRPPLQRRKKL
ncbi:hypothetical protein EVAR_68084_1 [Eumeta japonica]|uniref:Uncharacterized protein n=1 Tax=Eumeta variegata TaxID=151549 RepID=A0A4C1ZRY8_EUMVA|nr:hypothetical protein EVAR_68084_1 [Eumeta japonica]